MVQSAPFPRLAAFIIIKAYLLMAHMHQLEHVQCVCAPLMFQWVFQQMHVPTNPHIIISVFFPGCALLVMSPENCQQGCTLYEHCFMKAEKSLKFG